MASSTLDSLVLELGLDSKKLNDGMRHVISQLKQDSAEIVTATAAIEKQGTKASEVFKDFKRTIIEVGAVFLGGRGIVEFIGHLTHLEFQTGMVAKQMGLMPEKLSAWQGVMRQIGGTSEEMTQSLQSLQDVAVQARFGNISAQTAGVYNALGVNPRELDPTRQLEQFAAGVDRLKQGGTNPALIRGLLGMTGMDQNMMNLMFLDPKERANMLREQEKMFIILEKDALEAKNFRIALGGLEEAMFGAGKSATQVFYPAMTNIVTKIKEFITNATPMQEAVAGIGVALAGIAALPAFRWLLGGGALPVLGAPAAAVGLEWWLIGQEAPNNPERQAFAKAHPDIAKFMWGDTPDAGKPIETKWSKDDLDAARKGRQKLYHALNPFAGDDPTMPSGDALTAAQIRAANPGGLPEAVATPTPNARIGAAFGAAKAHEWQRWHHRQTNTSNRTTNIHLGQVVMPNVRDAKDFVRDMPVEVNRRAAQVASVAETPWNN